MKQFFSKNRGILLLLIFTSGLSINSYSQHSIELELLSSYHTGIFAESAAEISSYDPESKRLFVTNAATGAIDIYNISNPTAILLHASIDLSPYGAGANSVSVKNGVLAAAVENFDKQLPGKAIFFDMDGVFISQVTAGALPDMVTFTPNGRYVLLANEGEPNDDFTIDPEGSVTIVDLKNGVANLTQNDVSQLDFNAFNNVTLDESIRVSANPGTSTVAQDLEPEYITVSKNSKYAWVALQENNALALIDIRRGKVLDLIGLGYKDHSQAGNGIDASNKSDGIQIDTWPIKGMYMPDAMANYRKWWWGGEYIVLANEGDSRDYGGYSEETRVADLNLDPFAFPNAAALQEDTALGRLKTTIATGDRDGDGLFEEIYVYGARSFSIRKANGRLIYDSGDDLESITADALPNDFNSTNDESDSFKDRSDDKGPEPEAVEIAKIHGRYYAFIGLERVGGIAVYDISNPYNPIFIEYVNNRDFSAPVDSEAAGDLGPEDILFISKHDSPNHNPMIVVSNEVSGTISIFNVNRTHSHGHHHGSKKIEEQKELSPDPLVEKVLTLNPYPNPVKKGVIHFGEKTTVTIYSMSGVALLHAKETNYVDVSSFERGLYILKNESGLTKRIYIK